MNPDRAAQLFGAVDAEFGESCTLTPMTAPIVGGAKDRNARRVVDVSRQSFDIVGPFTFSHQGRYEDARPLPDEGTVRRLAANMPSFKFQTALAPWRPVKGDRLTRALTGKTYEVTTNVPDGFGRSVLNLTAET